MYDRDTGNSRGFGFVTFETNEMAAKAMAALEGTELGGRYLGIKVAMPRAPREDRGPSDRPKGVCFAFQKGTCTRGEECRFSHDPNAAPSDHAQRPCFDFQNKGSCSRGDDCRFAHTERTKQVCFAFRDGNCTRGDDCRYEHEAAGGAAAPAAPVVNTKKKTFDDSDDEAVEEKKEEVAAPVVESKKREREEETTPAGSPVAKKAKSDFSWKKTIKSALKEGPLSMKKLRKQVLKQYVEAGNEEGDKKVMKTLFAEKLSKVKKAVVDGKTVTLA